MTYREDFTLPAELRLHLVYRIREDRTEGLCLEGRLSYGQGLTSSVVK
jgi:hypothetical protein